MPRKPRVEVAGGLFHVYARGNNRALVFLDDTDLERYLLLLGSVVLDRGWRCLGYCLMPNHVHLLVETPKPNLARGMQVLHGDYGWSFNRRHERCGHVFQGRYGAVLVKTDAQLWTVVRYIARNPVAAGLCSEPEGWRWSSHAAVIGDVPRGWLDVPRLLTLLSGAGGDPRRRYAELTATSAPSAARRRAGSSRR